MMQSIVQYHTDTPYAGSWNGHVYSRTGAGSWTDTIGGDSD